MTSPKMTSSHSTQLVRGINDVATMNVIVITSKTRRPYRNRCATRLLPKYSSRSDSRNEAAFGLVSSGIEEAEVAPFRSADLVLVSFLTVMVTRSNMRKSERARGTVRHNPASIG